MKKLLITESQAGRLLKEDSLTKTDVSKTFSDMVKKDKDFEKRVKELSANVVKELFRVLWQRNNFWDQEIRK